MRLEWISAAEGEKVKRVVNDMVETLKRLGPLGLPRRFAEWDREMTRLEAEVTAHGTCEQMPSSETKPEALHA